MAREYKTLAAFLNGESSGARYIYHTGDLATDRKKKPAVDKIAKEALSLYEASKVVLTQYKIPGTDTYLYIAEKK